jgi:hypothetical protein
MNIQSKLFISPDHDNHVIMIARGIFDANAVEQILSEIEFVTTGHLNCKVLIDLIETESKIDLAALDRYTNEERRAHLRDDCKIALVSYLEDMQYTQISAVSAFLAQRGLQIALFGDVKGAVDWLSYKS